MFTYTVTCTSTYLGTNSTLCSNSTAFAIHWQKGAHKCNHIRIPWQAYPTATTQGCCAGDLGKQGNRQHIPIALLPHQQGTSKKLPMELHKRQLAKQTFWQGQLGTPWTSTEKQGWHVQNLVVQANVQILWNQSQGQNVLRRVGSGDAKIVEDKKWPHTLCYAQTTTGQDSL